MNITKLIDLICNRKTRFNLLRAIGPTKEMAVGVEPTTKEDE
jgi:hypothetical protein